LDDAQGTPPHAGAVSPLGLMVQVPAGKGIPLKAVVTDFNLTLEWGEIPVTELLKEFLFQGVDFVFGRCHRHPSLFRAAAGAYGRRG